MRKRLKDNGYLAGEQPLTMTSFEYLAILGVFFIKGKLICLSMTFKEWEEND